MAFYMEAVGADPQFKNYRTFIEKNISDQNLSIILLEHDFCVLGGDYQDIMAAQHIIGARYSADVISANDIPKNAHINWYAAFEPSFLGRRGQSLDEESGYVCLREH